MAVATTNAFSGPFTANGVTTIFPFTFSVMSGADVTVALRDADGLEMPVSANDYAVTLTGTAPSAGAVTFDTAPATGNTVWLYLDPAFTQETEFANGHPFLAGAVNNANDRAALRDLVLLRDVSRSIYAPIGEEMAELPRAADRAGKYLAFTVDGDPVGSDGTGADAGLRADLAASSGSSLVGFLQAGSGAVARSVQNRLRETLSVKDFGAQGDGSTDDTAAINLAIASASGASATTIFFPPGVYKVTSAINITRGQITLRGDGQGATVIRVAAGGVDVIKVRATTAPGTISNFAIVDMQIDTAGSVTTTAGSGIYLENVVTAAISNVTLGGHLNSIAVLGCFNVLIDNVVISYGYAAHGGRTGIYISKATAPYGSTVSANIFINGATATGGGNAANSVAPGAAYGMYVDCVDGLWVDNSYFGYFDQASIYCVMAGNMMSGLKFSNVWLDNGRNYGLWMSGSSGSVGASEFSSLRMVGGTNCVYNAYIAGGWGDVHFVGGHAEQATDHCFACVSTGSDITFTGLDCDAPATRTNKSCLFFDGPNYVRVVGCTINGGAVGSSLYGVYINGGVGHVVSSNTFLNCAIAAQFDGTADYWSAFGNADGTNVNTYGVTNNSTGTHFYMTNLGRQSTGYGTPTGAAKVANFPGATATLVQCSNMIAQIVTELKSRGIFAA